MLLPIHIASVTRAPTRYGLSRNGRIATPTHSTRSTRRWNRFITDSGHSRSPAPRAPSDARRNSHFRGRPDFGSGRDRTSHDEVDKRFATTR